MYTPCVKFQLYSQTPDERLITRFQCRTVKLQAEMLT